MTADLVLAALAAIVLLTVTAALCKQAASDRRTPTPEPPVPSRAGGKGFPGAEFGPETDWTWSGSAGKRASDG